MTHRHFQRFGHQKYDPKRTSMATGEVNRTFRASAPTEESNGIRCATQVRRTLEKMCGCICNSFLLFQFLSSIYLYKFERSKNEKAYRCFCRQPSRRFRIRRQPKPPLQPNPQLRRRLPLQLSLRRRQLLLQMHRRPKAIKKPIKNQGRQSQCSTSFHVIRKLDRGGR